MESKTYKAFGYNGAASKVLAMMQSIANQLMIKTSSNKKPDEIVITVDLMKKIQNHYYPTLDVIKMLNESGYYSISAIADDPELNCSIGIKNMVETSQDAKVDYYISLDNLLPLLSGKLIEMVDAEL